jgi:hypothetical protein
LALQALKLDEDAAREEAVLQCLHAALQYAVTGAMQYRSIQCVVLCVFTLHCCRGRGSAEQKQQRQGWHTQLNEALPSGDKARWASVGWVDPRLESHATQDRFGFEWNQRGQHPTVEAWAEAVRDDWTKFMHKVGEGGAAGRSPGRPGCWLPAAGCYACQYSHCIRLPPLATRHAACMPMPNTGHGLPVPASAPPLPCQARVADTIDFKLLERLPTKNPDSLRELLHEVEQPVDRRLGKPLTARCCISCACPFQ